MNELDRILMADVGPDPTPGFCVRVMERIRTENEPERIPKGLLTALLSLFALLVGVPILLLTVEGSLRVSDGGLSFRLMLMIALLVATSLAAVLPLHLLDD